MLEVYHHEFALSIIIIGYIIIKNCLSKYRFKEKKCFIFYLERGSNTKQQEPIKKAQNNTIANVAGSVWLSMLMDGCVKSTLPPMPTSTGLSRSQHLNMVIVNSENLLFDTSVIPWQAAYGPKWRKQWAELNKMEFWKGFKIQVCNRIYH